MPKSILVIDDERAIRNSFLLALEESDHNVETASSGEEGIKREEEMEFSLIFLDLKMPGLSGVETLEIIRGRNSRVPIYIVTAFYKEYFSPIKKLKAQGLEFEVIQKPIGSKEIIAVTESVLGRP